MGRGGGKGLKRVGERVQLRERDTETGRHMQRELLILL